MACNESAQLAAQESERVFANELLEVLSSIMEKAATTHKDMLLHIRQGTSWNVTANILQNVNSISENHIV